MIVRIQAGRGGTQTQQALNLNQLLGLELDHENNDLIKISMETVPYTAVCDDGTRRPAEFYPEEFANAAREGRLESHFSRSGFMLSNEIVLDFGDCNFVQIVIIIGKFTIKKFHLKILNCDSFFS